MANRASGVLAGMAAAALCAAGCVALDAPEENAAGGAHYPEREPGMVASGQPPPAPPAEAERDPRDETEADLRAIPPIRTSPEERAGQRASGGASVRAPEPGPPLGDLSAEGDVLVDDFERSLFWKPVAWENANDCDIALADLEKGLVLALDCRPGEQRKAGAELVFASALDVSGFEAVVVDVKVDCAKTVRLAAGFETDAYYESPRCELAEGWHRGVRFRLSGRDFKTTPEWTHDSALGSATAVRKMFLLVYDEGDGCRVLVDDVRLVRKGEREGGEPSDGGDEGAAGRAQGRAR